MKSTILSVYIIFLQNKGHMFLKAGVPMLNVCFDSRDQPLLSTGNWGYEKFILKYGVWK